MVNLNVLLTRMKGSSATIDKFCNIRKYIPVEEKFKFIKEYDELLKKHIDDYKNYESFVAFIMFNLLAVKYYTDIDIELTYSEFDVLQKYGIIDKIMESVGSDYSLLLSIAKMGDGDNED